jgi:hypothetical protein
MTTYNGGCHCGNVRYRIEADISEALSCNCSICSKTGGLLTFVPAESFTLTSGEGRLTDYQFNKKNVHHLFCPTCGIRSFATGTGRDGKQMYMVNVRCLDGFEYDKLPVNHYDGKNA